ncbi:MAG TPA: hypothetical protein VKI61_19920, partial [Chitinophagaceae bacterium]|nr:hypothetical protein [Chitinophagaceae bacterium]
MFLLCIFLPGLIQHYFLAPYDHCILKGSRTFGDVADSEKIKPEDVAEAIQYTSLDPHTHTEGEKAG